jgi:hypothetical protein
VKQGLCRTVFVWMLTVACVTAMTAGSLCAHATLITYSVSALGPSMWRYEYRITNDTLPDPIGEFTVFFDRALYSGLAAVASPAGWDSIVVQPDSGIPSDGFFDSLALATMLEPGHSLSGFAVEFNYSGTGPPGPQRLAILDTDFNAIDEGVTVAVPEPSVVLMMGACLALLTFIRVLSGRRAPRVKLALRRSLLR